MDKIKEAAICKNSISNSMTSRSLLSWKKKRKKRRDNKPNNKDELRTAVLKFVSKLTADHKFGTYR